MQNIKCNEILLQDIYLKMIEVNQNNGKDIFSEEEIDFIRRIDKIE